MAKKQGKQPNTVMLPPMEPVQPLPPSELHRVREADWELSDRCRNGGLSLEELNRSIQERGIDPKDVTITSDFESYGDVAGIEIHVWRLVKNPNYARETKGFEKKLKKHQELMVQFKEQQRTYLKQQAERLLKSADGMRAEAEKLLRQAAEQNDDA